MTNPKIISSDSFQTPASFRCRSLFYTFFLKNLHIPNICCNFASQNENHQIMVTTVGDKNVMPITYEPLLGNYENDVYYTREEFMDELSKQLGQAYGLKDIREA